MLPSASNFLWQPYRSDMTESAKNEILKYYDNKTTIMKYNWGREPKEIYLHNKMLH